MYLRITALELASGLRFVLSVEPLRPRDSCLDEKNLLLSTLTYFFKLWIEDWEQGLKLKSSGCFLLETTVMLFGSFSVQLNRRYGLLFFSTLIPLWIPLRLSVTWQAIEEVFCLWKKSGWTSLRGSGLLSAKTRLDCLERNSSRDVPRLIERPFYKLWCISEPLLQFISPFRLTTTPSV